MTHIIKKVFGYIKDFQEFQEFSKNFKSFQLISRIFKEFQEIFKNYKMEFYEVFFPLVKFEINKSIIFSLKTLDLNHRFKKWALSPPWGKWFDIGGSDLDSVLPHLNC